MSATMATGRERYWVPGDWNAFFGFGTNILVNVLVLTGLLRFVLKMPDSLVFGSDSSRSWADVCSSARSITHGWRIASPRRPAERMSALSRPAPACHICSSSLSWSCCRILLRTNDPIQAWEAGLTWVFVQSFVLMAGGFIAPVIRRITPRAALLGSLAGISITFISMRPGLLVFRRRS